MLQDGAPYVRVYCARCWERYEEQGQRYDEVQALSGMYDPSKDDLFYRDWLTWRELFITYRDVALRHLERIDQMLGGTPSHSNWARREDRPVRGLLA